MWKENQFGEARMSFLCCLQVCPVLVSSRIRVEQRFPGWLTPLTVMEAVKPGCELGNFPLITHSSDLPSESHSPHLISKCRKWSPGNVAGYEVSRPGSSRAVVTSGFPVHSSCSTARELSAADAENSRGRRKSLGFSGSCPDSHSGEVERLYLSSCLDFPRRLSGLTLRLLLSSIETTCSLQLSKTVHEILFYLENVL